MRAVHGILPLACLCVSTVWAQSEADSADIFYQHLELNEVVVSAPTGQMKRKEAPTPITVVAAKTLRQTASTNIIDAIAHQPGVAQVTTGSGISKPVIRGLGYNRIITLADGVRQEGQQWGDEHGIEVDAQSVGQVEVLKGPASLVYGSDALAGVIILHPENVEPDGVQTLQVGSEYQTNSGLFDYSLRFGGNEKGVVWSGRYSEKMAHAYHTPRDGYVPGAQFHERAVRGMSGLNRDWGFSHLTLSYYHLTPSMIEGERDALTGELVAPDVSLKSYSKTAPFQQIRHYKAVLDNMLNVPGGTLKMLLGYQNNRRQEFEDPDEAELDFLLHTMTFDTRYVMDEYHGWRITGGIAGMYQRSLNNGEEFLIPAYRLADIGGYATANRQWARWTLSGGLRFDHRWLHSFALQEGGTWRFTDFRRSFDALSGSFGAVFHANRHLNMRGNIARGFRAPNLSELGSNGVHEGSIRYEIGNRDLREEHSWQSDLGFDYQHRYFTVVVDAFLNRIDNYIFATAATAPSGGLLRSDEGFPVYRYTQGDALLKGFEASLDVHPLHQLHLASTFSLVDARQLRQPRESRYLPLTPAPRLTGEVKWEFTHNGDHHAATSHHVGEAEHHHRLDHVFDNAFISMGVEHDFAQKHYYMADATETATPAYTLCSLTLGTDILLRGRYKLCEVCLLADNLFNIAYQSHLNRLKYAEANPLTGRQGICNPGRNVTLKVVFPLAL